MSKVRAKFQVESVTVPWEGAAGREVKLFAVHAPNDPNHENHKFWKATPQGNIRLYIENQAAWEAFEPGQQYYVDFTPAVQEEDFLPF